MIPEPGNRSKPGSVKWLAKGWRAVTTLAKRHPRLFWSGALATAFGLALLAFLGTTVATVVSLDRDVSEIIASVQGPGAQNLTTTEGYADLIQRLNDVEDELGRIRQRSGVLQAGEWVPGLGSRVSDGMVVLEMAERFTRGTRLVLQGYAPAVSALDAGPGPVDVESIKQNLESARPLFEEAQRELVAARVLRARLAGPPGLGGKVDSSLEQMDRYIPLVELAVVVARDTPQLVGEVIDLRNTVRTLRNTMNDPTVLFERPGEIEAVFRNMQARARQVQGELVVVKSAVEGSDAQVVEAVDAAIQVSVLLADMGDALGRLAYVAEVAFTEGLLSHQAAVILGEQLPKISQALQGVQQELAQVNTLVASQQAAASSGLLALLGTAMGRPGLPLQREEALIATGVQAVDFLTFFLGYDASGTKKYLLIGQNDDEIRATGGFIGVVAEITVERGELVNLRYLDSTTVDAPPYDTNPSPPEAIYKYLWISKLLFRDGNWNPHFPASAAQLADLYQRAQGVQVDGVIATTKGVVLDLVDAMGGIRVPELPDLLDRSLASQYVEGELPYSCLPRHVSDKPKRCFDEDLFQAVIGHLLAPMPAKAREGMVQVLLGRLRSKDVLVHVFDPQAAELLWEQGWNGALRQVDHDYLMIVDSSLPGHARSIVERRVQYQVTLAVGQPIEAQLLLEYRHKGKEPDPDCRQALALPLGCFWDYLRVFIPVVAQDIQSPPIPLHEGSEWLIWGYEPADSLSVISSPRGGQAGLTEIGGYLVVEPQTSVTLPLHYQLPTDMIRNAGGGVYQYRLLVQKQPGTPVEPVTVFVRLPEGATLVRTSPAPTAQKDNWVRLDVDLAGDTTFTVDFRPK
ncbi:MAG: DUF4012 domain-containing protein [Chloroflexota bacterium]